MNIPAADVNRSSGAGDATAVVGRGPEGRIDAASWRRRAVPATVALALALSWSSTASAQAALLTTALTGLVKGFTGGAGNELWGWMTGGGQSAGIAAISTDLGMILDTLNTIEAELGPDGPIVEQLKKLQCAEDSDWIAAGPATDIGTWYDRYADFLTEMNNGVDLTLGEISTTNTDVTTLYGWANGVIQGNANVAPNDVFTAMVQLNNLSVSGSSTGTIADCIEKNGNAPAVNTLDDRPYYSDNVLNIQNYLLNLNAQAMIVLTEAYHIYAYGDCVTGNGGDASNIPAVCQSSSADDVIANLCPSTGTTSANCYMPITIYGELGTTQSGQFLPFTYQQFQAGGAPYSTDDYVMENGNGALLAISIETYNAAAGADCPDPVTTLCGPTVGAAGFTMESFAVGPYDYGSGGGNGTWEAASYALIDNLLFQGYNQSHNGTVAAGAFLCTMSLTGGDLETCTQANGGAGLKNVSNKGIYFPETINDYEIESEHVGTFQCFLDGNLVNSYADQPVCDTSRFGSILDFRISNGECFSGQVMGNPSSLSYLGLTFPDYYNAGYCSTEGQEEWLVSPGYLLTGTNSRPESLQWPALDLATLTCSDGSSAADALNPASVPTLCGADFDAWFNVIVPPGPTTTTAIADTTISRSAPNANDGAGSRHDLRGRQALIAFDQQEIQAFLDAGPLDQALLVLTSSDTSAGGRRNQVVALSLLAAFVEGNGKVAEDDPGTGTGATWNCAEDAEIGDDAEDCLQEWPRRIIGKWRSTPRLSQEDGYAGPVSFDVTEHVADGISAWLIHRERGSSLSYHSREGAAALGDESLTPKLILTHAAEQTVSQPNHGGGRGARGREGHHGHPG